LVYADRVEKALEWLDLERLAEYGARTLVVVFSAIFFLGALVIALRESGERKLIGAEKPLVGPLLGSIEIMVVLSLVDLLFATFVGFQFTYLFGGEANITAAGYTYSEYARRGFGELVAVGVLSLGLILLFAYFGKRESRAAQGWFKGLSALLVLEVGVILASALRRLLLYEGAYGFTRLRTYTHLFIPWMGLLLVAFLVLLFMRRVRRIAPAAVIVSLGFVATMNIVNVDAFIVRRNVARLRETGDIDLTYLASLSEDAVPALIDLARTGSEEVRAELLPELACWEEQLEERASSLGWPSTHFSRLSARKAFSRVEREWVGTEVVKSRGYWYFKEAKEDVPCGHQSWLGWID
jgi:hypothetical protein